MNTTLQSSINKQKLNKQTSHEAPKLDPDREKKKELKTDYYCGESIRSIPENARN